MKNLPKLLSFLGHLCLFFLCIQNIHFDCNITTIIIIIIPRCNSSIIQLNFIAVWMKLKLWHLHFSSCCVLKIVYDYSLLCFFFGRRDTGTLLITLKIVVFYRDVSLLTQFLYNNFHFITYFSFFGA